MKLHPKQKILKAVATQRDNRFATEGVYLDKSGAAVATDGRICVVIPDVAEEGDVRGRVIEPVVIKEAMRPGPTRGQVTVGDERSQSGNGADEMHPSGEYPKWENVIPDVEHAEVTVNINPKLLMNLIEATGVLAEDAPVIRLRITDPGRPIRVDTNAGSGAYGVIMPLSSI